jgi:MFS family permease
MLALLNYYVRDPTGLYTMTSSTHGSLHPDFPVPGARPSPGRSAVAPSDIAVGVVIGRASEYFDFFVYGIASVLVFPAVFFPNAGPLEGTLRAFALFALAFFVRPLGTLGGDMIQRRFGRSTRLTGALFLLGVSTVCMAALPGYESIGAWAVAALMVCRIGQGVALGASWDGLPSLLAMNAPEHRRGWYAMLGQLGAPLGFLIAAALFGFLWTNLSREDFLDWGWRYPFFTAFAINVVALFARLRLVVTHEYERGMASAELEPSNVEELFSKQGGTVVIGAFVPLASYALFHLVTVFPISWIHLFTDQPVADFLGVQMIGAVLAAAAMPVSGLIADRIGRHKAIGALAVLIGLFALAVPFLLAGDRAGRYAFVLIGFVVLGLSYAQAAGAVSANFLPRFRYTGAAITTDLAWLIGAALAPLVALGVSARFGPVAVTVYLLSGVVCTLIALGVNRRLKRGD